MIIAQILACSLHLHTYNILIHAKSTKDLETKLHHIELNKKYSKKCQKEWHTSQFPKSCILLIETAAPFIDCSPKKIRLFVNNHCKQQMDWSKIPTLDLTDIKLQKHVRLYPKCHEQLKEELSDRQYKIQKSQLRSHLKNLKLLTSGSPADWKQAVQKTGNSGPFWTHR